MSIKGFLSISCMRINSIQSTCASKHYNVLFNHNHWKSIRFADFNQWNQLHCGQTSARLRSGEDLSPLIYALIWLLQIQYNPEKTNLKIGPTTTDYLWNCQTKWNKFISKQKECIRIRYYLYIDCAKKSGKTGRICMNTAQSVDTLSIYKAYLHEFQKQ